MTRQEFEHHILCIKQHSKMFGRLGYDKDIIEMHREEIQFHENKLNEFYDRHQEEE